MTIINQSNRLSSKYHSVGMTWKRFKFLNVYWNIKKRLLLRCIHHFKSDLINNMDHMRISGTEPLSVVISQNKVISKV